MLETIQSEVEVAIPASHKGAGKIVCARVNDADVLRQFYLDERIWSPMKCDGCTPASEIDFNALFDGDVDDTVLFVKSMIEGEIAGLFMFDQINPFCYEIHSALLPRFWGRMIAPRCGLFACRWLFENTDCVKIVTMVPTYNIPAFRMAMNAGMQVEGVNRESFMKNGIIYDQVTLGFTKEEALCQ